MKIDKAKILSALKTTGSVFVTVLKSKAFWTAVAVGVSYLAGSTSGDVNTDSSNAEVIVHGVEVVVCAILNGCI